MGNRLWGLAGSALPALAFIGLAIQPIVIGCICLLIVFWRLSPADHDDGCETNMLQQLRSPDGVRNVVLKEEHCPIGMGSDAAWTVVQLTSLAHPDQSTDLIFSDGFLDKDQQIGFFWSDPRVLRITLPLFYDMKIKTQEADGVHVDITFDPDDPAARVAWLAKRDELGRAQDAYLDIGPPPADPAAKSAWLAKDEEVRRTFGQTFKEVEDIKSRAAARNRGAP